MTQHFSLPYGKSQLPLVLPQTAQVDWIEPAYVAPAPDPQAVLNAAIEHPVDGFSLSRFASAQSVVIAINDKTRPVPHDQILPPLLDAIHRLGISREAVTLLIAMGTHIPMPEQEYERILPESIYRQYRVISHACDNPDTLVSLGSTSRSTPILANRMFVQADLRIVVGNIEPHHFAGFSGGAKTAAIGLAGRATINANHAMLSEPGAEIGEYFHNPLRMDIEEIGDALQIHCALNVILNGEKQIVSAVFGSPRAVMAAGIPLSRPVCQVQAREKFDLVFAAVGGAPKDINFYQSQKALTHASQFTRDGGMIVLAAACPEGTGSRSYEEFMHGLDSPEAVFAKFRAEGFQVGPHKAFQVARIAARLRIVLVSDMPASLVQRLLMTPAANLFDAVELAAAYFSPTPLNSHRIAVLPRATNTILSAA